MYFEFQFWNIHDSTVVPTKSDSDEILCLQLLSKPLACKRHLSWRESIDHLCINPILRIGLIHKWSIDHKSLITLSTNHEVTVTLGWQDSAYIYWKGEWFVLALSLMTFNVFYVFV